MHFFFFGRQVEIVEREFGYVTSGLKNDHFNGFSGGRLDRRLFQELLRYEAESVHKFR